MMQIGTSLIAQYNRAHEGFYLSMAFGGTYLSIKDDITNGPYQKLEMKGSAVSFDLKLGYALTENIIIHGDIIGISSMSIDLTADGQNIGTVSGDNSVGIVMLGAGGTYYFLPGNIFISGTIGAANFSITEGNSTESTQTGLGLYAKAGKEWKVSKRWGLGVSIGFNYTSVNNNVDNMTEKLKGTSFGLSFNASRN